MDLPILFIGSSLFGMIIYLSTRLNDIYAYKYFNYIGLMNFYMIIGAAYGYFLGTLAKTQEALVVINPVKLILIFRW